MVNINAMNNKVYSRTTVNNLCGKKIIYVSEIGGPNQSFCLYAPITMLPHFGICNQKDLFHNRHKHFYVTTQRKGSGLTTKSMLNPNWP